MTSEGNDSGHRERSSTALRERHSRLPIPGPPKRNKLFDVIGGGAVVLAVLGLTGTIPLLVAAFSATWLGLGLTWAGVSYANDAVLLNAVTSLRARVWFVLEAILGVTGGVLGLVGLFAPAVDGPTAWGVVALGLSLAAGGVATARLADQLRASKIPKCSELRRDLRRAAAGEAVSGICAAVVGAVALWNVYPTVCMLLAVLVLGSALVVAGGQIAIKISEVLGAS